MFYLIFRQNPDWKSMINAYENRKCSFNHCLACVSSLPRLFFSIEFDHKNAAGFSHCYFAFFSFVSRATRREQHRCRQRMIIIANRDFLVVILTINGNICTSMLHGATAAEGKRKRKLMHACMHTTTNKTNANSISFCFLCVFFSRLQFSTHTDAHARMQFTCPYLSLNYGHPGNNR